MVRVGKVFIGTAGAVITGVIALVARDDLALVPDGVVASVPGPVLAAVPWLWKALGAAVVVFVAWSIPKTRRGPGGGTSGRTRRGLEITFRPPGEEPRAAAAPRPPAPHLAHPVLGCDRFVGRAAERQALTDWFRKKRSPPVLPLVAAGGAGKSTLAWVWVTRDVLDRELPGAEADSSDAGKACRVPAAFRPKGVLWWSFARPPASFGFFLDEAIAYLSAGAVQASSYLSSRSEKVETLLSLLRGDRFLLVLDGFERELRGFAGMGACYRGDEHVGDPRGDEQLCSDLHAAGFLRRIAARPMESRVLIVSRLLPAELGDPADFESQQLGGLEPADGAALLRACGIDGESAELESASETLGGHPLALRLLAGLGEKRGGRVADLKRILARSARAGDARDHVLESAFAALNRRSQALLGHVAVYRQPIGLDQLEVTDSAGRAVAPDEIARGLTARGLLARDPSTGRCHVHPLVRRCAYEHLADPARVHEQLADHFGRIQLPVQITSAEELRPALEHYHHLVCAGRHDEAYAMLSSRVLPLLRDKFADQQALMVLLGGLFEGTRLHLRKKTDRLWALDTLAKACSYSGETRRAVELCERNLPAFESKGDEELLVVLLGTAAGVQARLGRLQAAERNLRRLVDMTRKLGREPEEAVARNRLGLLLSHRGAFDDAVKEFDAAYERVKEMGDRQVQSVCFSYYTQRALLMNDSEAALDAARKSRAFVEESARRTEPNEHDYVRSGWLLGAALIAGEAGDDRLEEAQRYLCDALSRCRRGDLVGFEPDLLLTSARLHRARGETDDSVRLAGEALVVADRCEYRLKQAEANNFLARLAADAGDVKRAAQLARRARDRAWCDGPPHVYRPAVDEADKILAEVTPQAA